ncbi:MAG: hypothetical protein HY670_11580 [Chloroflexi bacterium]|nr:hypothetical protein [Chloroflexota bacterium]
MTTYDWKTFANSELLKCFADLLDELKQRGIVRSRNNPVADYGEWLVESHLGFSLERKSKRGFDASDPKSGKRYQIKSRRLDPTNQSTQLSVIRSLAANEFDYLIGILFDRDFSVREAYKIPHGVIQKYARFSSHQNGYILHLQGALLRELQVENITDALRAP